MKTVRTIYAYTLIYLLYLLCPLIACAFEPLSFAIIGDTRIGLTDEYYHAFINRMDSAGIGLIFHTGDVINKPGDVSEWKQFQRLSRMKKVIIAPGNHDLKDAKSLSVFEQIIQKPPYYSFSLNNTQMIISCTDLPGEASRITGKQLEWLVEELRKPFRYRFIFLHQPLFPSLPRKGYNLDRFENERDNLHNLFVKNNVNLVVSGHEHLYKKIEKDGISYVISGGGGAKLYALTDEQDGFFHYIIAKRYKEGYVLRVYDFNGKLRDLFQITHEVMNG